MAEQDPPSPVEVSLLQHHTAWWQLALNHSSWNGNDWSIVLFSNRKHIQLWKRDGRNFVFIKQHERFAHGNVPNKNINFGGGLIIYWAGIHLEGRWELVE